MQYQPEEKQYVKIVCRNKSEVLYKLLENLYILDNAIDSVDDVISGELAIGGSDSPPPWWFELALKYIALLEKKARLATAERIAYEICNLQVKYSDGTVYEVPYETKVLITNAMMRLVYIDYVTVKDKDNVLRLIDAVNRRVMG